MTQTAVKPQREIAPQPDAGDVSLSEVSLDDSREWQAEQLRLLWGRRRFIFRAAAVGIVFSALIAFLIPTSYISSTKLMPPDTHSPSVLAAIAAKNGGGLASVADDLLGLKTTGALFIGVLRSQTAQDRLIQQFDLRKVYSKRLVTDARTKLDENTSISEDRKSGIITISVTDHSPERAAALASAYVDQLNSLVSELSTSSAHRERVFLEERLKVAKQDLDFASNEFAQFSSKNSTLDIQLEGKAMLDVAANLAGQLAAAQSELEGMRRIYSADPPKGSSGDMPYPSIRNLPLLGVKYADYYRHAKMQETVYELLTEQYELAKVQEAKETPSVKMLDPARVPEKKSFPPRLVIICLGTFLVFAVSVVWVLGSARWDEFDPQDPRKVLLQEVAGTLGTQMPWASRNGAGAVAEEKGSVSQDSGGGSLSGESLKL